VNLTMNLSCSACGGSGTIKESLDLEELLALVKGFHSNRQKIDAIKAVRNRDWLKTSPEEGALIRLRAAKELVEAAFQLFDSLDSMDSVNNLC